MAGIKEPLQDILTRLATLDVVNLNGDTVKLYARVWNNQLVNIREAKSYNIPLPAAFVEMVSPVVFGELGQNMRGADIGVNIHLVHEYLNEDGTFEQDLEIFDLRDKILALLSQYQPTACSPLACISEEQDFDHDNLYHYILSFITNFTDSKASPYDIGRGIFIESEPPTTLELNVYKADSPIFSPIPQPFKIPKR